MTNICQLLVPVIFICFAGIIQVVLNHFLHKNGAVVPGSNSLLLPYGISIIINCTIFLILQVLSVYYFVVLLLLLGGISL